MDNNLEQNLSLKSIKKLKKAIRIFKKDPDFTSGCYDKIIQSLEECIDIEVEHFEKLRLMERRG